MSIRRAALIATRLLAIFLFVRGLENFQDITFYWERGGIERWIFLGAYLLPLLVAILLWTNAEPLAARLARGFPLSAAEIDRALTAEDGEVETELGSRDVEPAEADDGSSGAWMIGSMIVLGAYFVVRGVSFGAFHVAELVLFRQMSLCDPAASSFRSSECSFFNPQTIRTMLTLGTSAVQLGFGVWFIVDPAGFLDRIRRIFKRFSRVDPGEEMVFEEDLER